MPKNKPVYKTVLAAFFFALAYILPFLTGQIPKFGALLCPMHIPILLCGYICGWPYGLAVGFLLPLFRSLTLTMPPLFPKAVCMAFELAAYGMTAGIMHKLLPKKKPFIYCSLIVSMLTGRLVWGIAMFICLNANGEAFTLAAFLTGAFANSVPGIIIQLLFVPVIVFLLENKILKFKD